MYCIVSDYLATSILVSFGHHDIISAKDDLWIYSHKMSMQTPKILISVPLDEVTNVASEFANPKADNSLSVTLQTISITVNVIMSVFSVISTYC